MTDPAIIEAAARAWLSAAEIDDTLTVNDLVERVLTAVTPLIEAAALEKAEQAIRQCSFLDENGNILATRSAIAAIRALIPGVLIPPSATLK